MPTPISDALSSVLRSDSTAALAALMLIANAHQDLFAWAARMVCDAPPARVSTALRQELSAQPPPRAKGNGVEPHGARASTNAQPPAARKASTPSASAQDAQPKSNGTADHLALRREARDRDDERLLEAMRESPASSIGDWAEAVNKSRTSVVAALHRLRDAGLAESIEGRWRLSEDPAHQEPPPKETRRWVAPLKGADRAAHAHLTAS
jgi:hypothetical protein